MGVTLTYPWTLWLLVVVPLVWVTRRFARTNFNARQHLVQAGLRSLVLTLLALATHFAAAAQAPGDEVVPTVKLEPVSPEYKSRIGLTYLMGLNITVDFKRLGGLALSDPGSATGTAVIAVPAIEAAA